MSFVPENENKVHPCGFPMDNVFSPTLSRCMSVAPTPMEHIDDEDYEYVDDKQQYFATSPGLTRSMTINPPTLTRSMSVAPAPMDYSDDEDYEYVDDDRTEEYFATPPGLTRSMSTAPPGLTRSMSTAPPGLTRSMSIAPEPMDIQLDLSGDEDSEDEQYLAYPPGLTISTPPTSLNMSENIFEIPSPHELTRGVNVAQYYMGNIPSINSIGYNNGTTTMSMDVDVGVDDGEIEKES